ncbi:hypothetical protein ASE01_18795 [Nocardioides sp. Root190]|uniref:hypothetical protein n=1 Tax=Nocardioides sp. Root190 TaxID=1736488 RepID=UPI0006F2DAA8|nr:hypothetical protein [Nocardioides sp. Root190]KRB74043.1 hypothetical protein ASE01_18795 [Nocardioides sp. Root190]
MVASRSARERKAGAQAGPLARVRIEVDQQEQFVYKITCTECTTTTSKGERPWSAYRPGDDNGFMATMDRWTFHLRERHPASEAPCLEFIAEAEQRLQERRAQQGSPRD